MDFKDLKWKMIFKYLCGRKFAIVSNVIVSDRDQWYICFSTASCDTCFLITYDICFSTYYEEWYLSITLFYSLYVEDTRTVYALTEYFFI